MTWGWCKFSTTSKNVELKEVPLVQGVIMATLVSTMVVACEALELSSMTCKECGWGTWTRGLGVL
jgi:hypothetical protein